MKDYREITIRLWGKPLAKQSVKFGKHGAYTPAHQKKKAKDYIEQINKQLPEDFEMFENDVIVKTITVCFPPLAGFSKKKIESIKEGAEIPKTTRPDLIDNLNKLAIDCMSGIVFKDDALIWKVEGPMLKIYGIEGYYEMTLKGR